MTGWDGSGSQTVTVRFANKNRGGGGDRVTIWDTPNTTQLPLGMVELGDTGYVDSGGAMFGGPTNSTHSTMTWNSTTGAITVTLGPVDSGSSLGSGGSAGTDEVAP